MKRFVIVITLLVAALCTATSSMWGRTTAAGAFVNAPSTIFPMLDRNARLDMIDYYNSGSETYTRNLLKGESRITAMDSDMVTIEMTDASVYHILLLQRKNKADTLFALIRTVKLPAADSDICFFSNNWERVENEKSKIFNQPSLQEWFVAGGSSDKGTPADNVPFMLSEYIFELKPRKLVLKNRLADFMGKDEFAKLKPFMADSIVYVWDSDRERFKKQK